MAVAAGAGGLFTGRGDEAAEKGQEGAEGEWGGQVQGATVKGMSAGASVVVLVVGRASQMINPAPPVPGNLPK